MTSINEVSRAIGQLQADAKNANQQRDRLGQRLEQVNNNVNDLAAHVKKHIALLEQKGNSNEKTLEEHKGKIEELNRFRSRVKQGVAGVVGATGLTGGGVGAWLFKMMDK